MNWRRAEKHTSFSRPGWGGRGEPDTERPLLAFTGDGEEAKGGGVAAAVLRLPQENRGEAALRASIDEQSVGTRGLWVSCGSRFALVRHKQRICCIIRLTTDERYVPSRRAPYTKIKGCFYG